MRIFKLQLCHRPLSVCIYVHVLIHVLMYMYMYVIGTMICIEVCSNTCLKISQCPTYENRYAVKSLDHCV